MNSSQQPSRRDFLKGTTTAAGLALAGGLTIARSAQAAGSDELKIVLVGCGGRGSGAVRDCLTSCENVKLIAVADAFEDKAVNSLKQLRKNPELSDKIDVPADRIFSGFDAYKQAIAAGPDIVFLTTSPGFRPIHYAAAIAAGKHVFMEKPVCVDAPGFRSVMATNKLADEKNLKVVVGLQRRYQPSNIERIKEIHDGKIGDLVLLRSYYNSEGIWFRERKPEMTEMEYQVRNWYHFVWLCGDQICEQHVHGLDFCNWAKDAHPVEANGMGSCVLRYKGRDPKKGMGQIFDNHFVEFTYEDGSKLYTQCRHIRNAWTHVGEAMQGTKGVWDVNARAGERARVKWSPQQLEHMALVEAIRNDQKHNNGWYGATSSFTAVLGRMATYSGQVVKWDEAVKKGPSEMPKTFAFDADPPVMPDATGNYPIPVPGVYKPY
jgi:myo-inositol 2-dehydrogenase / D-chiro-inositol 1-dehydrogenase